VHACVCNVCVFVCVCVCVILSFNLQSKLVMVPGNHHVHLNNAAIVAPIVNEWLTTDVRLN